VRSLLIATLALALGAPALAQTPPPETVTFEGLGTPIPYKPGERVPAAARVKSVTLAGGGLVRLRTRGGAGYAALVTHFGTTGIVAVTKKGKIVDPVLGGRYLEMRIRKSPGARFDSFVGIQAGFRLDDKGTPPPATSDDEIFYDNPGGAAFQLYDQRNALYPPNGALLQITRTGGDPLNLVKEAYDLTTTSLDFTRILIVGDLVFDDLVVSYGH
jgi:hypothetical protein